MGFRNGKDITFYRKELSKQEVGFSILFSVHVSYILSISFAHKAKVKGMEESNADASDIKAQVVVFPLYLTAQVGFLNLHGSHLFAFLLICEFYKE